MCRVSFGAIGQSAMMAKSCIVGFVFIATFLNFISVNINGIAEGYPTTVADAGTFWQITDIHWDDHYSQKGNPDKMCHILINETKIFNNGVYGNFDCDSPWILIKSAVQAMKQYEPNPDFIIWTGDNAPHLWNPAPDIKAISHILSNVTRLISSTFPNATVLPVIGNHDTFPPDTVSPGNNSFYNTYLTAGRWNEVLPNEAWNTFLSGGYYIVELHHGLKLIGLNTILWYQANKLTANSSDPGHQFSWLESKLETARKNNEKVYIIGHVPPGHSSRGHHVENPPTLYHEDFNNKYISVINEYGDVVVGQFFAHLHYDTFGLFLDNVNVKSSMLLSPSITPWHSIYRSLKGISVSPNPSVRLYHYDRRSGKILNYEQYFLNLTKANTENRNEAKQDKESNGTVPENEQTEWELLYSFTDTYNQTDVSTNSLVGLSKQLLASPATFEAFYNFTTAAKDNGPCDSFCHKMHICAIAYLDHQGYADCIKPKHTTEEPTTQTVKSDVKTNGADGTVTPPPNNTLPSSGSSRNILIGCTLSLLVIIMILVVVYIKRSRLAKGPRFVRFQ